MKQKYKLKIVTLEGCPKCKYLKEALQGRKINFEEIDCDKNSNYCDDIERITKTNLYPVAVLEITGNKKTFVIHLTENSKQLGTTINDNEGLERIPLYGPEHILQTITNKLN